MFHFIKINLFILFVSFIIFGLVIANNLDLGWDAKYFYHTKSLFFYEGLGLRELSEFEHNKWHPHFGSFLWAFFWSIPIFDIEYFGRLFYLFIFCFSIYFITVESNKNTLFNSALFFLILLITFNYERFSGLQEILIFSFLIISSKILYDLKISNKIFSVSSIYILGILWLGALIGWDKPILKLGVMPFLVAEIFKICLLTLIAKKIIRFRKCSIIINI